MLRPSLLVLLGYVLVAVDASTAVAVGEWEFVPAE